MSRSLESKPQAGQFSDGWRLRNQPSFLRTGVNPFFIKGLKVTQLYSALARTTLAVCFLLTTSTFSLAQESAAKIGIVKEKPKSGLSVEVEGGFMVPYTTTIPGTEVTFEMVPIPGGTFVMGSPESEADREESEGPQRKVTVEPFWMGKHEVTWSEYAVFMELHDAFKEFQAAGIRKVSDADPVDVVTVPSNLYDPSFTYEAGDGPRQPAVTMTQFGCKQYTKWLSLVGTKQYFRLPTEAEWEYACRAGSTSAYYFGDDPSELGDYAWYYENSDELRHDVGQKKPNAFGLYDMHGNAAEWVLDAMDVDGYKPADGKTLTVLEAYNGPVKVDARSVRGGSFEFDPEQCRSSSRMASEVEYWKEEDPNIPLSPWWFTTYPATGVGMRLIRPLETPATREAKEKFWKADVDVIDETVNFRIDSEGRGARGVVDGMLPEALKDVQ